MVWSAVKPVRSLEHSYASPGHLAVRGTHLDLADATTITFPYAYSARFKIGSGGIMIKEYLYESTCTVKKIFGVGFILKQFSLQKLLVNVTNNY